jgi:hypothetical protein
VPLSQGHLTPRHAPTGHPPSYLYGDTAHPACRTPADQANPLSLDPDPLSLRHHRTHRGELELRRDMFNGLSVSSVVRRCGERDWLRKRAECFIPPIRLPNPDSRPFVQTARCGERKGASTGFRFGCAGAISGSKGQCADTPVVPLDRLPPDCKPFRRIRFGEGGGIRSTSVRLTTALS